jgi:hypothetical protein
MTARVHAVAGIRAGSDSMALTQPSELRPKWVGLSPMRRCASHVLCFCEFSTTEPVAALIQMRAFDKSMNLFLENPSIRHRGYIGKF